MKQQSKRAALMPRPSAKDKGSSPSLLPTDPAPPPLWEGPGHPNQPPPVYSTRLFFLPCRFFQSLKIPLQSSSYSVVRNHWAGVSGLLLSKLFPKAESRAWVIMRLFFHQLRKLASAQRVASSGVQPSVIWTHWTFSLFPKSMSSLPTHSTLQVGSTSQERLCPLHLFSPTTSFHQGGNGLGEASLLL